MLLSLVLQENTQSTIIRKLNSQSRHASLRDGFIEYNKILKSTHVLNHINNMLLFKAIRIPRNLIEEYHKLQNIIRKTYYVVHSGIYIVNHKISTQAVRLITNTVVAYNATILSMLYMKLIELGCSEKDIKRFLRIFPMI